jgi:DNA-directed RNA polymerase specialized sigma24 family protein
MDSVSAIAGYFGFSQSKITSILFRTRKKLRAVLEQEDLL